MPETMDAIDTKIELSDVESDSHETADEAPQAILQSSGLKFSQIAFSFKSCGGKLCKSLTPSHGVKMLLGSVMAALAIGGLLAFGVLTCFKVFDAHNSGSTTHSRADTVASQKIVQLMSHGKSAYELRDYANAAKFYEQAQDAKPNEALRFVIEEDLTACYIQLAQIEKTALNLTVAKEWYDKALKIGVNPLTVQAQFERAEVLGLMARIAGGFKDETQKKSNASTDTSIPVSQEQTDAPFRRDAQQLINLGDALYRNGDLDGARKKWIEATGKAPGNSPEHDAAMQRLNQTSSTQTYGSSPNSSDE